MIVLVYIALTLLALLLAGLPIAAVLGTTGLIWIAALDPVYLKGAGYAVLNTATNETLIAVPLFILMGEIIQRSDVARRFYDAAAPWLGRLPGGLLHANIAVCSVFAAVSGSSIATAATIGTAAIPNLERLNYNRRLTYGTLAAGGTLGILIPPSIPMIIYGALVEESVGRLFIAAIVPAIVIIILFEAYILIRVFLGGTTIPGHQIAPFTRAQRWASLRDMVPLIAIIVVVLGGIYRGWTTPTEAAGLGAVMALAVAWMQGTLSWRMFAAALTSAAKVTGMLMFIVLGAQIFAFAVFSWGINSKVADFIGGLPYPPYVIMFAILMMYFVLGMFIDALSMMVMTLSVVHPIVTGLGFDSVWFGIVLVALLEIGLITPPVGMNLFTIQAIQPDRISLSEVAAGSLPFVLLLLVGVTIFVAFPDIVLWLPAHMN